MKLRPDLVQKVTPQMVEQEALANRHRYQPEPLFSQTGSGSLSSASTNDSAAEEKRSMERIQKLTKPVKRHGKGDAQRNARSSTR
jgi:hypothetical protein